MQGLAKQLFQERAGIALCEKQQVKWPFLWSLVEKKHLLYLDYFFAEKIHPLGNENEAALLALLMAFSRAGHLCMKVDAAKISTLIKDPLLASQLEKKIKEASETFDVKGIVRNGKDCFYLQKNWFLESSVCTEIKRLLSYSTKSKEQEYSPLLTAEQKKAVENALHFPLSMITGGPGTGKSFTALQIVAAFPKSCRVILTAPTGKAASHLLKKCTGERIKGGTLHAILKEAEPLEADLVIADECSMIDAALFSRLLSSIKEGTHLVLMGDPDQLPAVEGGSFFADLVDAKQQGYPLPCTYLTECLRSDQKNILNLALAIRAGKPCMSSALYFDEKEVSHFFPLPSFSKPDPQELLKKMDTFRILSTLRKGPFGVDTLNQKIVECILAEKKPDQYCPIPILITKNDKRTGLFNGEMGILIMTPSQEEEYAFFDDGRIFPAFLLPSYEYAYCLSVHKSQGSEYDKVLLLIPEGSDFFGKEALYTAVTRAKKSIEIRGSQDLIRSTLQQSSRKASGLTGRLV